MNTTESMFAKRWVPWYAIIIALVMVFSSVAYSTGRPSSTTVATQSGNTPSASAQPISRDGSQIIPGNYVTLTCTHGQITVGGVTCTSSTSPVTKDLCDTSPSCQYTVHGSVLSGYGFADWTWSGSSAITNSGDFNATLTVYVANPAFTYSSSVTLATGAPAQVKLLVGSNATIGYSAALVQVAGWDFTNGQNAILVGGYSYPIDATRFAGTSYSFSQWTTYGVSVGNFTTQATTLNVGSSGGTLGLVPKIVAPSWAGYVTVGSSFRSVSAYIQLPAWINATAPSGDSCQADFNCNMGFWVGIGGYFTGGTGGNLWQAGVSITFNNRTTATVFPFFEAESYLGVACHATRYGCAAYNGSANLTVSLGNLILATVSTTGTVCSYFIENMNTTKTWQGSEPWSPDRHSVEWAGESPAGANGKGVPDFAAATFSTLKVNGTSVALNLDPCASPQFYIAGHGFTTGYVSSSYLPFTGWPEFFVTPTSSQGYT